jgi:hypothetical protein
MKEEKDRMIAEGTYLTPVRFKNLLLINQI